MNTARSARVAARDVATGCIPLNWALTCEFIWLFYTQTWLSITPMNTARLVEAPRHSDDALLIISLSPFFERLNGPA